MSFWSASFSATRPCQQKPLNTTTFALSDLVLSFELRNFKFDRVKKIVKYFLRLIFFLSVLGRVAGENPFCDMAAVVPPPAAHGHPQQHHQRLNKMTDLTDVSAISCVSMCSIFPLWLSSPFILSVNNKKIDHISYCFFKPLTTFLLHRYRLYLTEFARQWFALNWLFIGLNGNDDATCSVNKLNTINWLITLHQWR